MTLNPGNPAPGVSFFAAPSLLPASLPHASHAASGDPNPQFARAALSLILVAAAETASRQENQAQAWLAHFSSSNSASAWNQFHRRVEQSLRNPTLDLGEVRRLASEAPQQGGEALAEFRSLLNETDPELFALGILNLAERNLRNEQTLVFARELLRVAATYPATRERAEARLSVLNGGGSFASQLEFQAPHLIRELTSPLMLASYGTALLTSRLAAATVLARVGRLSWGSLLLSEGAALAVEVPSFTFSRRMGTQLLAGGEGVFEPDSLRRDLLSGFTTFGLLRVTGNVLQLAAPQLRRLGGFNLASGELSRIGNFTFESLRFGGELSALAGAHSLNVTLGLEAPTPGSSPWLQALLGLGQMRLAGRVMQGLGIHALEGLGEAQRASLLAGSNEALLRLAQVSPEHALHGRVLQEIGGALREGRISPLAIESWVQSARSGQVSRLSATLEARGLPILAARFRSLVGTDSAAGNDGFGLLPQLAFAAGGRVPSWSDPRLEGVVFMSSEGGDNNDSSRPSRPPSTTRRDAVLELLRRNLEVYSQHAENRDTVLGKAAKRLQDLLERGTDQPDLLDAESLARQLEEVERELGEARAHEGAIRRSVETLKVLLRRSADPANQTLKPEVVQQQSDRIEKDEEQRSAFASALGRMGEVLQQAKVSGWSERLYRQLDAAKDGLNGFYGKTVWKIPGLNRLLRRGASGPEILDRRHGAALGLVVASWPGRLESPVRHRLLALEATRNLRLDADLELLHESILLAASHPTDPVEMHKSVQKIAENYRVSEETGSAMYLASEAVSFLVRHGAEGPDLMEHLNNQVEALNLHDRLLLVSAMRDPKSDVRMGIEQLGHEALAADYLSSSLLVLIRSEGDPGKLVQLLQTAQDSGAAGFHPSLAVSLYGAAYGRKGLPESLQPHAGVAEAVILRAFHP